MVRGWTTKGTEDVKQSDNNEPRDNEDEETARQGKALSSLHVKANTDPKTINRGTNCHLTRSSGRNIRGGKGKRKEGDEKRWRDSRWINVNRRRGRLVDRSDGGAMT